MAISGKGNSAHTSRLPGSTASYRRREPGLNCGCSNPLRNASRRSSAAGPLHRWNCCLDRVEPTGRSAADWVRAVHPTPRRRRTWPRFDTAQNGMGNCAVRPSPSECRAACARHLALPNNVRSAGSIVRPRCQRCSASANHAGMPAVVPFGNSERMHWSPSIMCLSCW